MYAITATVVTDDRGGYSGSRQIPTFYLDECTQGIVSESHAQKIAADILSSSGISPAKFYITAVKV